MKVTDLNNREMNGVAEKIGTYREALGNMGKRLTCHMLHREPGIDGILVTVGLCIIALLLCVVMKDSLATFIENIVTALQTRANGILTGV